MDGNPQIASQTAGRQSAGLPATGQAGEKGSSGQDSAPTQITPELVSQLADRVLSMLLLEMKVEKERCQRRSKSLRSSRGGW